MKLDSDITAADLIRGECELPQEMLGFFRTLLAGYNYRKSVSKKTDRLTRSFVSDIIYSVTNGKILPSKSITLGSALKSLVSSKKVIKILHAYGHVCGYDVLQGLETEGTYTITKSGYLCPSEIKRKEGLRTATAFDN